MMSDDFGLTEIVVCWQKKDDYDFRRKERR